MKKIWLFVKILWKFLWNYFLKNFTFFMNQLFYFFFINVFFRDLNWRLKTLLLSWSTRANNTYLKILFVMNPWQILSFQPSSSNISCISIKLPNEYFWNLSSFSFSFSLNFYLSLLKLGRQIRRKILLKTEREFFSFCP